MYLPRFTGGEPIDDGDAVEPLGQSEDGETILVVEDDEDVRNYLGNVLRSLGYRVIAAGNGKLALERLAQQDLRIDLMLTDVVMPGMNGRELAKSADVLRPQLKVIYMTGYSQNAVSHHGRLDPGLEILQKPITQSDLATRIRDVLDKRG
jgi:CheY-like chemotaxis protein